MSSTKASRTCCSMRRLLCRSLGLSLLFQMSPRAVAGSGGEACYEQLRAESRCHLEGDTRELGLQVSIRPCPFEDFTLADLVAGVRDGSKNCTCIEETIKKYLMQEYCVYGSTVTLVDPEGSAICAPYVYRNTVIELNTTSLMKSSYDIDSQPWLRQPVDTKEPHWSGVYFDEGGGNIDMETYSLPVLSADNSTVLAVVTSDVPANSHEPILGGHDNADRVDDVDSRNALVASYGNMTMVSPLVMILVMILPALGLLL